MSKCEICDGQFSFRWTDSHGIGACSRCGAPYRIYHYEDDVRVEKSPELLIVDAWLPLTKRYWSENQRNCAPGAFNFPGSSYEVASPEDVAALDEWMAARRSEWPEWPEEDGCPGGKR